MEKKLLEFSNNFVKELSKFFKEQKKKAKNKGIDEKEFKAIASTTFSILGRGANKLKSKAGL